MGALRQTTGQTQKVRISARDTQSWELQKLRYLSRHAEQVLPLLEGTGQDLVPGEELVADLSQADLRVNPMTCLYSRSCRPTRWLGEGSIVPPRSYKWDRLVPAAPVVAARLPFRATCASLQASFRRESLCFPGPDTAIRAFSDSGRGRTTGLSGLSGLSDGAWAGIWAFVAKLAKTCDRTKLTKLTVPSLAPASRVELRTCPEWGQATLFLGGGKWVVSFVRFVSRFLEVFLVQSVHKNSSNVRPDRPDKPDNCLSDPRAATRIF